MRRSDCFFAAMLGLPVLTIGAAVLPFSGPTVQVANVGHVHRPSGGPGDHVHNPATDHADFENVMPAKLMTRVVSCINRGSRC